MSHFHFINTRQEVLKRLLKLWTQYPGSVVPLAMFSTRITFHVGYSWARFENLVFTYVAFLTSSLVATLSWEIKFMIQCLSLMKLKSEVMFSFSILQSSNCSKSSSGKSKKLWKRGVTIWDIPGCIVGSCTSVWHFGAQKCRAKSYSTWSSLVLSLSFIVWDQSKRQPFYKSGSTFGLIAHIFYIVDLKEEDIATWWWENYRNW